MREPVQFPVNTVKTAATRRRYELGAPQYVCLHAATVDLQLIACNATDSWARGSSAHAPRAHEEATGGWLAGDGAARMVRE